MSLIEFGEGKLRFLRIFSIFFAVIASSFILILSFFAVPLAKKRKRIKEKSIKERRKN
ncbi:MAG: hypothetical protein PHZ25_01590 [Candidatus Pacebacteria bacterium]|nr:hypothetical protein [Candidatus Paceibacterota bacterium]